MINLPGKSKMIRGHGSPMTAKHYLELHLSGLKRLLADHHTLKDIARNFAMPVGTISAFVSTHHLRTNKQPNAAAIKYRHQLIRETRVMKNLEAAYRPNIALLDTMTKMSKDLSKIHQYAQTV